MRASTWIRSLTVLASCWLLTAAAWQQENGGGRVATRQPATASHSLRLPTARQVFARDLPAAPPGAHPPLARPFRGAGSRATGTSAPPRTSGIVTTPGTASAQRPVAAQSTTDVLLARFPAFDEGMAASQYAQTIEPPDTQLAAGPGQLLEMVNSVMSAWTDVGALEWSADLNRFFPVPNGYFFSDPRVLYDAQSQRWFASGMSFDANNDSQVYLAVSQTSDPGGAWWVYPPLGSNTSGTIYDQPFLGVNSDKVVISWNDYPCDVCYAGAETWVVQKSDAMEGAPAGVTVFGPDPNRFRMVPAQALTPTSTEYLVDNSADAIGVVAITGTPDAGTVVRTERDFSITPLSLPPPPQQPGGTWMSPADIDNRFLGAVWQDNVLWTAGNDGCVPSGRVERDCARLIQLSTAGGGAILQDFDWAVIASDVTYPAVAVDGTGNLHTVATESSVTAYPFVIATGQAAGGSSTLTAGSIVESGQAAYVGTRWGDYSGAAVDPANPSVVWVAGEYAESTQSSCWSGACNWATGIGELMFQTTDACTARCPATQVTPGPTQTRTPAGQVTPRPTATRAPA